MLGFARPARNMRGKAAAPLLRFRGAGYSRPYPGMIKAVRLVAQSEGIVLDPNYTGKSMAGLLDAIRKGAFTADQHVVYLHTGGLPALFAMRRHFAQPLLR